MKKSLSDFLKKFLQSSHSSWSRQEALVGHITTDSRKVTADSIFVAIQGLKEDGHRYLEQVSKSALWCIGEKPFEAQNYTQVHDARLFYAQLCAYYFDSPAQHLKVIAITGTSGKTTTSWLIEDLYHQLGYKAGHIGTIGASALDGSFYRNLSHTTPDAWMLQSLLYEMYQQGVEVVAIEISSHALVQKRCYSIPCDVMVFTNLDQEHLDYHKTMEEYFLAKMLLFTDMVAIARTYGKNPIAVIQQEDPYGQRLMAYANLFKKVYAFNSFDYTLSAHSQGISGTFNGKPISTALVGEFNVTNLVGALTVLHADGLKHARLTLQKGVPGRLEHIHPGIYVDYAHKPDALKKVLLSVRTLHPQGRLIVVFGCGGDRDQQKRPLMGKIAAHYADIVVITSDNPRSEKPETIIEHILAGISKNSQVHVMADRKLAIHYALSQKTPNDAVIIAGKGHEVVQIVGKDERFFSDANVVREYFYKKNSPIDQTLDERF